MTFKEYDNLGIGYMAALLSEKGIATKVLDIGNKKTNIYKILKRTDPLLVGFSVVFQYYIDQFIDLISFLRREGINCHFTAGGHYASLKYDELFEYIPFLDSIVRFEGEYTILELAGCIQRGENWKRIDGLVYKNKSKIVTNAIRPFEKNLDKFPFPLRSPLRTYAFELKFATMIAGRGCLNNCAFCNAKKFYNQKQGFTKRIRKPELVVEEMSMLYQKKGCSIFLFLDDDFPVKSTIEPEWVKQFCDELDRTGLTGKILWKINCRPDEVDEESFRLMKRHGLFLIFLGIEDGTDSGLKRMKKNMTVDSSLKAVSILKKLEIGFDYGFMLFQPSTNYASLNENLDFLKQICNDGFATVTFNKMMPYYETRIEKELVKEGRLKVMAGIRDYDFLNETMDQYYDFTTDCFREWLRNRDGLTNTSNWAGSYISVYLNYFNFTPEGMKFIRKIRKIISRCNLYILETMKEIAVIFESNQSGYIINQLLDSYRENIKTKHEYFRKEIIDTMADFISQVEDQQIRAYLEKYTR